MKRKALSLILLLLTLLLPLQANVGIHSHHLTTADGLSNNSVRVIYQDSKGFIWMGSLNGLNRYDGNSFRTFLPQNADNGTLSLADRRIRNMVEDKNQLLWITTSADLISCYDLKRDRFVDFTGCGEYSDKYSYVELTDDGTWLWGGNLGCRRIVYRNGVFSSQAFDARHGNLPTNRIFFVKSDTEQGVWIGTDRGLYYWREEGLQTVEAPTPFLRTKSWQGNSYFIAADGCIWQRLSGGEVVKTKGRLPHVSNEFDLIDNLVVSGQWLIFTTRGGYLFNPHTEKVELAPDHWNLPGSRTFSDNHGDYYVHNGRGLIHRIESQTGQTRTFQVMSPQQVTVADMERYHVVRDKNDVIWMSIFGNGLFAYDLRSGQLTHYKAGNSPGSLLPSDALMCLMEDRNGGLWIGSEYTGATYLNTTTEVSAMLYPQPKELDGDDNGANKVRLLAAVDEEVYVGTRNGILQCYDNTLSSLTFQKDYGKNIYAIARDAAGIRWMGSRGDGLYVGEQRYQHQAGNPHSLPSNHIYSLLKDAAGRMWIGTFGGGLSLAQPDGRGGYNFRTFFSEQNGERRIRSLIEDRNGWIWAGTSEGVIVFHPDKLLAHPDSCYRYNNANRSLHSNEVRHLMQDKRGNIYVAEAGSGFSICRPEVYDRLTFTHYGTEDGLVNNMVQAFVEDTQGNVWITTEYGISCFTPQTENFENFFFSGDMAGNICSEASALRLADGRLLIGTTRGAMFIHPLLVRSDDRKPSVTFTNLRLNGITVTPEDADSPLEQSIAYTDEINLMHDQNSFSIHFSTLDYAAPTPCKYSYLLENYDKAWSQPDIQSAASYKSLTPGTYHLRVKAISASGQWGDEAVLKIVVSPPFWKAWYAYLIYIALLSGGLFALYRIFRRMNELRNKIKVEEQLTEYKLVFFTNISHEFRTPLTLIQAALEKMHRHKIPAEMADSVQAMTKSTHRMLRLINQLLEFRKMQNNKLALSLEETDIIAFLHEIYLSFKDTAESKKMEFAFLPSLSSHRMFIDKGNVDKVVYNLLSNAFKYTPSGGKVTLAVQIDGINRRLIIRVTDTGVGVPREKQPQLFSRFMQSNFARNSTGIGLHLTHELVNVHKGTIRYEENPTGGSIFTVSLPLTPVEYEEKDFLLPGSALLAEEGAHSHMEEVWQVNEKPADNEEQPQASPINKRKLLIIEDDADICNLLKQELSIYFEVETASDGKSGLERARTYDADLIVSDVMMPGYNGLELTQKLKADFQTSHIPIILLTALTQPEQHLEGIESGADAYLTKPFSIKLLLARIFKLIEQRDKLKEKFSSDLSVLRPVISTNERDKEFTDKLTRIADEQMENPEFCVEDYAAAMNMSRSVFFKKVKGVTGYAPMEYLRVLRLKKGAELLATTDLSIGVISAQVGIGDQFYFSRCFKAQFGLSPSAYQKKAREEQCERTPDDDDKNEK